LGTRGARRVHGDYMVTEQDLNSDEPFDDTIAVFPDLDRGEAESIALAIELGADLNLLDEKPGRQIANVSNYLLPAFKASC